jgi:hypothetical protein
VDGLPDNCGGCTLKIYKNQQIVYEETRDICPEVEELPCRLSDEIKEIKIEKAAYLERIEVRNQTINVGYAQSPLIEVPFLEIDSLPENCLNIYKTYTLAPPFLNDYVPLPGIFNPYEYIAQICSSPDCPPPEYQVICDCDCIECPQGTCAVECEGQICCYDPTTGKAIAQIPIEEYCDEVN